MEMKKNAMFVLAADFSALSKDLIASLECGKATSMGNRFGDEFVFVRRSYDPECEITVSLSEKKDCVDSDEQYYVVSVIDPLLEDEAPGLYETKDMTEDGLAKLLQEIWVDIVNVADQENMTGSKSSSTYVPAYKFDVLSKKLIDGLDLGVRTIKGNRHSGYFCFARGQNRPADEISIGLIEETTGVDPSKQHYLAYLFDGAKVGDDPRFYRTHDMTERGLTKLLQEIWNELTAEKIGKDAEFAYLKSYIGGCCLDDESSKTFLISLWIAYCLHQGLTPGDEQYMEALTELWNALLESDDGEPSHWEDFTSFEYDMSRNLR